MCVSAVGVPAAEFWEICIGTHTVGIVSSINGYILQCSSQNFTIAGGIASVSDCSTVNSCDNLPQIVFIQVNVKQN